MTYRLSDNQRQVYNNLQLNSYLLSDKQRQVSVVECLTRDQEAAGSSLTGITALWSLSKTHLS